MAHSSSVFSTRVDSAPAAVIDGKSPEPQATPDEEYYFTNVTFRVGKKLFRVPRDRFDEPGTLFPYRLLPADENSTFDLPVDESSFRNFLRVIYPFCGRDQMTIDGWFGVLDLATRWQFSEIRAKAVEALETWVENQSAKEAVLFAKRYRVLRWLKAAYLRLIMQQTLSVQELRKSPALEWETIAKLLSCKQIVISRVSDYSGNTGRHSCTHCGRPIVDNLICICSEGFQANMDREFRDEFQVMEFVVSMGQRLDTAVPAVANEPAIPRVVFEANKKKKKKKVDPQGTRY